jgi:hypothetical protein
MRSNAVSSSSVRLQKLIHNNNNNNNINNKLSALCAQGIELYKDNLALCDRLNAYYGAMQGMPALRCVCCTARCYSVGGRVCF